MLDKPYNILIVDDDEHLRHILSEKLLSEGFHVQLAKNGEEALHSLTKHPADLVLLDILMPKKDGLQTLKEIRTGQLADANIPVIMLTNVSEKEMLAQALEMGVDDYIIKAEIKLQDLVKKIKAILGLSF